MRFFLGGTEEGQSFCSVYVIVAINGGTYTPITGFPFTNSPLGVLPGYHFNLGVWYVGQGIAHSPREGAAVSRITTSGPCRHSHSLIEFECQVTQCELAPW